MIIYPEKSNYDEETGILEIHDVFSPMVIKIHPWTKKLRTELVKKGLSEPVEPLDDELKEIDIEKILDHTESGMLRENNHYSILKIPEKICSKIIRFKFAQFTLLQILSKFQRAQDYFEVNPILIWLLAGKTLLNNWSENKVKWLLNKRQSQILQCLYSNETVHLSILKKLSLDGNLSNDDFLLLDVFLTEQKIDKRMLHQKVIPKAMLCAVRKYSRLQRSKILYHHVDWVKPWLKITTLLGRCSATWSDCIRMATLLEIENPERILNNISTPARLKEIHDSWSKKMSKSRESDITPFPTPPIPGNMSIEPIHTAADLHWEGVLMNHCVYCHKHEIRNNELYVYKVLSPQRGTLAIKYSNKKPTIYEFKLKDNKEPSKESFKYVKNWLKKRVGKSPIQHKP